MLHFFLAKEAQNHVDSVRRVRLGGKRTLVWPVLVHALLERYATDSVLSTAHDAVTRIAQGASEDELAYADRLHDARLACANVFSEQQLVNFYLKGLQEPIRDTVAEMAQGKDFHAVSRLALAHGSSYRAAGRRGRAPPSTVSKLRPLGRSTKVVTSRTRSDPERFVPWDSESPDEEEYDVLHSDCEQSRAVLVNQEAHELNQQTSSVDPSTWSRLVLSPEQRQVAEDFRPKSTQGWQCWLCREYEHILFDCPFITEEYAAFAAYRNAVCKRAA